MRILVFGDLILDKFIYGDFSGMSGGGSVPVVKVEGEVCSPGGAGNVAANAAAMGALVSGMFLIGTDEGSAKAEGLLRDAGVGLDMCVRSELVEMIVKTRCAGNRHQVLQLNYKDKYELNPEMEGQFACGLQEAVDCNDVIVISDYGKGGCSDTLCRKLISEAKRAGKVVIVDPAGLDWSKYRGANILTPNFEELKDWLDVNNPEGTRGIRNSDSWIDENLENLDKQLGVDFVVVTRAEYGVSVIGRLLEDLGPGPGAVQAHGGKSGLSRPPGPAAPIHFRAAQGGVPRDVSGAGDTFVAGLAVTLAARQAAHPVPTPAGAPSSQSLAARQAAHPAPAPADVPPAVYAGNLAAAIAISKPGTSLVTESELKNALNQNPFDPLKAFVAITKGTNTTEQKKTHTGENQTTGTTALVSKLISESIETKKKILESTETLSAIAEAAGLLCKTLESGGKLLICGNGGSASDAQHIASELTGRFRKNRPGFSAISLSSDPSVITGIANDYGYNNIFSRQVESLINEGDILLSISTGGNAPNIMYGMKRARESGGINILLTGGKGGDCLKYADCSIIVPSGITERIQEAHELIYHIICQITEENLKV